MKKIFIMAGILFSLPLLLPAQADYKVVFDLTSKDSLDQRAVVRWVTEVVKASKDAQVEVVMYGQGVNFIAKGRGPYEEAVINLLAQNKNVSFKACAVAMKANNIDKSQLLPGVEVVPDGIYEIISKQKEGWGYIKAVH